MSWNLGNDLLLLADELLGVDSSLVNHGVVRVTRETPHGAFDARRVLGVAGVSSLLQLLLLQLCLLLLP